MLCWLQCFGDKQPALLEAGLLALVLKHWGLTGLSSSELVTTNLQCVKLQHLYLHSGSLHAALA